jgi:hypothetical protein
MLGFAGAMAIETKVGPGAVTARVVEALMEFDVAEMVAVPCPEVVANP